MALSAQRRLVSAKGGRERAIEQLVADLSWRRESSVGIDLKPARRYPQHFQPIPNILFGGGILDVMGSRRSYLTTN
ncbi:hypothetical protein [Brevundimonas sp.]|uniref:hypothetical protein n=1 Tax=Brevundimonas sp. TaxID=1871086 RepID=UPI003D0C1780